MSDLNQHFNLSANPWGALHMPTNDSVRIRSEVQAAATRQGLISISGPRGSGKTRALWEALEDIDVAVIEPLRLDRERMHLGDILTACVRDLSDETPRRAGEARSAQVRRLLRTAGQPVCLVIDDAHVLHGQTIRGLKRLRELGIRGRKQSAALAVILVGQADATATIAEVALRAGHLSCAGLTKKEAATALAAALGAAADADAVAAMAKSPEARNWLDLRRLAENCLAAARVRGESYITADTVAAVVDPGQRKKEAPTASDNRARDSAVDAVLRGGKRRAA